MIASSQLCDKCNTAPAQVYIQLASGKDLYFCYHHFMENKSALESMAVIVELFGDLAVQITDNLLMSSLR